MLRRQPPDVTAEQREAARWLGHSVNQLPTSSGSPADTEAFIPRDPEISLVQAQWDEAEAQDRPPFFPVVRLLRRLLPAPLYHRFADGVHLEAGVDPEWAKAVLEFVFKHRTARMNFPAPGLPEPVRLAEDARVVLVGDWGTGAEFAQAVADQIREKLQEARDENRATHVVHLGDVYYAGTCWEAEHRFLAHWPVDLGAGSGVAPETMSWCLNGNHDMYAAGTGLFERILPDRRFQKQRTPSGAVTSQFHLRNDFWQIVGLDTSWEFVGDDPGGADGHLTAEQVTWLGDCVADDPGRRTIVLSHHPAFGHDEHGVVSESALLPALEALPPDRRHVEAWFWGHVHRLVKYTTLAGSGIDYAVCTGHGAVPEWRRPGPTPAVPGQDAFDLTVEEDGVSWYRCGFTILDFRQHEVSVSYVDLNGEPWKDQPDRLPVPGVAGAR